MRNNNPLAQSEETESDGTVAQDFGDTRVIHLGGTLRAKAAVRSSDAGGVDEMSVAAADAAMKDAFEAMAEARDEPGALNIEHREIPVRRRAGSVVWFDFMVLCGGPRSHNDYLEIASRFHTVLLSDVPRMPPRMSSEARRFTWLVDVLYDRRVKLVMSAADEPEKLYLEGPLSHEFPRTASRLREMQTAEFLELSRRDVDTRLT